MGLIIVYSNCDGSLKGRCYGNEFVTHVGKIDTPRLRSIRWHSTTVGGIAKRMGDFQSR